jgi:hypothetical protein
LHKNVQWIAEVGVSAHTLNQEKSSEIIGNDISLPFEKMFTYTDSTVADFAGSSSIK